MLSTNTDELIARNKAAVARAKRLLEPKQKTDLSYKPRKPLVFKGVAEFNRYYDDQVKLGNITPSKDD